MVQDSVLTCIGRDIFNKILNSLKNLVYDE